MPAFGTVGPYSGKAGYGPVVEGMGGFGARFGYEDEGARISDLYWPDPVAGAHAALAVLTGHRAARPHRCRLRDRPGPHGGDVERRSAKVSSSPASAAPTSAGWATASPASPCPASSAAADGRWVAIVGPRPVADAVAGDAPAGRGRRSSPRSGAAGGAAEVVNEVLDAVGRPAPRRSLRGGRPSR